MVRSLLLTLSASLALAASAAAYVAPRWDFVDTSIPEDVTMTEFGCHRELRGVYEDLSIYSYPGSCSFAANMLSAENDMRQLIVLERQHLEGDSEKDIQDWNHAVHESLRGLSVPGPYDNADYDSEESAQVRFRSFRGRARGHQRDACVFTPVALPCSQPQYRIVIGSNCAAEETAYLIDNLPSNTEILPVRTEGFVASLDRLPKDHPIVLKAKTVKHRQALQSLVDQVDVATMEQDVTWLSGEAPGSPFTTRSSTSKQSPEVAQWLKSQFESYGCDSVELMSYQRGFGPNVIW
jgi:hypothetical protein